MNAWWWLLAVFSPVALMTSCVVSQSSTPTPLPSWRSPVSELFVDEVAFPEGWTVGYPEKTIMDPTVNHVVREWWAPLWEPDVVIQDIWRAYTIADAEKKFAKGSLCFPANAGLSSRFPASSYRFPKEIAYRSKVADEWCLGCGVDGSFECYFAARYRNYVVRLYVPLEKDGSSGLTLSELENLLRGVDAQFIEHLSLPADAPVEPVAAPEWPICSKPQPSVESLLINTASFPPEWELAFPEWEWPDKNPFVNGCFITRNFQRRNCYSSGFEWCYVTQLVSWYPDGDAKAEWERVRPWLEEPSLSYRWEIPADITYHSPIADDQLIACAVSVNGERCEAAMRYGNYLITLRAMGMMFMGSTPENVCYGLTHAEFRTLVEAIDAKVASELDGVRASGE